MAEELWQLLGLYLLAVNVAAFLLMGADKGRARPLSAPISKKAATLTASRYRPSSCHSSSAISSAPFSK